MSRGRVPWHYNSGINYITVESTDISYDLSDSSSTLPTETHAEWVERDAEKHRRISEQYDREWVEEYMDEHDI